MPEANGPVLVVDDEADIRRLLTMNLKREGFRVLAAENGQEALRLAQADPPILVVLDLMLPDIQGTEVCRRLRAMPETAEIPILMLTARDEEIDRVVGFEVGADDYVTKPFSSRELVARIRAVMRRNADDVDGSPIVEAGPVRIDPERHQVTVSGQAVTMPLKEFDLLEYLVRNAGRVLTRGQLIDRIWGSDYVGDTKTLDVHVKRLRAKVESDPSHPVHLLTVRGLGYKLEG